MIIFVLFVDGKIIQMHPVVGVKMIVFPALNVD